MLLWMIFSEQLHAYFTDGEIYSKVKVIEFVKDIFEFSKYPIQSSALLNHCICQHFEPETANMLIDKSPFDYVIDSSVKWDGSDSPHRISSGYFIYADYIDWDEGKLDCTFLPESTERETGYFFNEEEHLTSAFESAEYDVKLRGLCFELGAVEMLLPSAEIAHSDRLLAEEPVIMKRVGRPQKWDWEGALGHIISIAQHPDGLPIGDGAQARIEDLIQEWFIAETGDSPATSQIRQKAQNISRSLNKPKIKF